MVKAQDKKFSFSLLFLYLASQHGKTQSTKLLAPAASCPLNLDTVFPAQKELVTDKSLCFFADRLGTWRLITTLSRLRSFGLSTLEKPIPTTALASFFLDGNQGSSLGLREAGLSQTAGHPAQRPVLQAKFPVQRDWDTFALSLLGRCSPFHNSTMLCQVSNVFWGALFGETIVDFHSALSKTSHWKESAATLTSCWSQ